MALGYTEGSPKQIWTDDLGGAGHAQGVKILDGSTGGVAQVPASTDRGLVVEPRQHLVKIPAQTQPVVTTGAAYAAGNAVGGKLTFPNAARAAGKPGFITNVVIVSEHGELTNTLQLVLFDDDFTAVADKTAFSIAHADATKVITSAQVGGLVTVGGSSVTDLAGGNDWSGLAIPFVAVGTSVFGQLVTAFTPTFSHVGELTVVMFVAEQ